MPSPPAKPPHSRFTCVRVWLLASLVVSACPAFGQRPLSRSEDALIVAVRASEDASFALLERVVNINSGTMNFAGVKQVADVLRPRFETLGFRTTWIDGASFGRAGHLIARRGSRGRHVLLIGHLDTVFEPQSPFQRFERIDATKARGPGIADMKGGIIVALAALESLQKTKALDRMTITVVLHGDEEESGTPLEVARKDIIDAARSADIAMGLENAADDPATAVTARRGYTRWQVDVKAKSAHSSQIFTDEVGGGAAYELSRILASFYEELRGEENVTFSPGLIAASAQVAFDPEPLGAQLSGKDNIIPPIAVASGDLRTLTLEQRERTKERMRNIVAAHLPQTSAEIVFEDGYPPMAPSAGNTKLLGLYDAVSRDLGYGPVTAVNPRHAGAADVSFAADHVEMAIDGLGLLGGGAHTPDEFADLRTFQIQAQRLALLLFRLSERRPE